jgi:hypothetical protein
VDRGQAHQSDRLRYWFSLGASRAKRFDSFSETAGIASAAQGRTTEKMRESCIVDGMV